MTSCDYCERAALASCDGCGAMACRGHLRRYGEAEVCNPDPATWPGRGCHKPPVAEVAE